MDLRSLSRQLAETMGFSARPERQPRIPRDIRNSREVQALAAWMESGRPLLVEPERLRGLMAPLLAGDESAIRMMGNGNGAGPHCLMVMGDVAVIPVRGLITMEESWMTDMMGWSTVRGLSAMVRQCMDDSQIKTVVADSCSPGGVGEGGEFSELANLAFRLRETKKTAAISRYMMGSAAYWFCSAFKSLIAAPLSLTGSIGCYTVLFDDSDMLAQMGVKAKVMRSDKYKGEGTGVEPFSEEYLEYVQQIIDACGATFRADVAKFRGVTPEAVRKNYGQGRSLLDKEAKAAGLVDRVMTSEDFSERLMSMGGKMMLADDIEIDPETWRALGFRESRDSEGEDMDEATLNRALAASFGEFRKDVAKDIDAGVKSVGERVDALAAEVNTLKAQTETQGKASLEATVRTFVQAQADVGRVAPGEVEEEIKTLCEMSEPRRTERMGVIAKRTHFLPKEARQAIVITSEDGTTRDAMSEIPAEIAAELEADGHYDPEAVRATAEAIRAVGGLEGVKKNPRAFAKAAGAPWLQ